MAFPKVLVLLLSAFALLANIVEGAKFNYAEDGTCTVDGAMPADTSYCKIDFGGFKCLADFQKFVMAPRCGDPWYDLKKYCAQVAFFGNKEIDKSPIVTEEKNQDQTMAVLSGCVKCNKGAVTSLELSLSYHWPSGSFFTDCWETRNTLKSITLKREAKKNSSGSIDVFTAPFVLWYRLCHGLFSDDEKPPKYEQIKLHVKHNCGGEKSFDVDLPDFQWKEDKDHLAEFLNVELDLDGDGKAAKYKGPDVGDKGGLWDWEK